jgi:hypothetical protein
MTTITSKSPAARSDEPRRSPPTRGCLPESKLKEPQILRPVARRTSWQAGFGILRHNFVLGYGGHEITPEEMNGIHTAEFAAVSCDAAMGTTRSARFHRAAGTICFQTEDTRKDQK